MPILIFNGFLSQGFANFDYSRQGGISLVARDSGGLTPVSESEDIGFLNAQVGAQFESVSIKLVGRNLSNELKSTFPSIANGNDILQSRPRTIGFEVNYTF